MKLILFIWELIVTGTYGIENQVIKKEICCFHGDRKVSYRDLDPQNIYVPVLRHETFGNVWLKLLLKVLSWKESKSLRPTCMMM